jgi:hypothetical protein
MTHLSALELQSLLEGNTADQTQQHLEGCAACQAALAREAALELTLRVMGKHLGLARAAHDRDWDAVSEVRARTSSPLVGAKLKVAPFQMGVLHVAFAAAAGVLPLITFSTRAEAEQASAYHDTQEVRCIRTQPWCR